MLSLSLLAAEPKHVAVKAARMLDVTRSAVVPNAVVLIEGDRIKDAGPGLAIPPGYQVIDLGQMTLLPGLIDCHTHITFQPTNYYEDIFRRSPIDFAVVSHVYARKTLEAGFTAIRDLGAPDYVDIALRKAIDAGLVPGPRIQAAGLAIGSTGGHADLTGFSPYLKFTDFTGVADGPDEIRKKVRENVKNGADVIKMIATAGVLTEEDSVGAPQYSFEEMKTLVDEAKMWGRKVAAHAHGPEGIKRALRAGVDSIEHGSLIDAEGIALLKERGAYLVSDIYNDDYILAEFKRLGFPENIIEKERSIGRTQRENFRKAAQAGVKMAFGTDAGVYPHGLNARQFALMQKYGLTAWQAIQTATTNAADLLGWSNRVGAIKPGLYADVIAVQGDPLTDITELERVRFVMKGGDVVTGPAAR